MKVRGFLLVLHLPFLLRLQQFLSNEVSQEMILEEEEFPAMPLTPTMEATKLLHGRTLSGLKKEYSSNPPPVNPSSLITIKIEVEQPDIVLVENLNSLDTSCVFLHSEMKASIRMSESQKHISATIGSLQMYTCCFNPDKREQTLSQILTRSELTLNCSSNEKHADHIQINLGTFNFRLAPDSLELAMRILSCLSGTEVKVEKVKAEKAPEEWHNLWKQKPIDFSALPSLNIDTGEVADETFSSVSSMNTKAKGPGGEELVMEIDCLLVTLEAGSGPSSIPLLKLQSDCSVRVVDFYSTKMTFDGHLSLEMAYFNPRQAVWEPLLEPVDKMAADGKIKQLPWVQQFEGHYYLQATEHDASLVTSPTSALSDDGEMIEIEQPPSLLKLKLTANDPLEFTITKTFLEVLTVLSKSFMEAYNTELSVRHTPKAPYKLHNHTGLTITICLKQSGLRMSANEDSGGVQELVIEADGEVELFEALNRGQTHRRHSSLVAECQITLDKFISIKIPSMGASCSVPVTKADKRFFSISKDKNIGLVTSVSVFQGYKVIKLSSCVKVKNELDFEVQVYSMTENGNEVEFVCSLEPQQESSLPLKAVYTPTNELFFSVKGYSVCINPLVWASLKNAPYIAQELQCQPRNASFNDPPFIFCANSEIEQIYWENTSLRNLYSIMMEIHLRPCIVINNLLPVALSIIVPGTLKKRILVPGASLQINHAQIGNIFLEIEILCYRSYDWKCSKVIGTQPLELSVWTFKQLGPENDATMDLGMHMTRIQGVANLSLYCPFWMINKTAHDLTYKNDTLTHSIDHKRNCESAVMFSFRSKVFFGKKKANIRLNNGDWSNKFPLDTVATAGAVSCLTNGREYQVSVDIQLASSGLTKIVTFSPFYKAVNRCPYDIQFKYSGDSNLTWHSVDSGDCKGLWPPTSDKAVSLRIKNTKQETQKIHFDAQHTTLFKLDNEFGGIFVEVTLSEGGCVVTLDQCLEGCTTALVLNHLYLSSITFWQEDQHDTKIELGPQKMVHFTWDSALSRRLLNLTCMGCDPVTLALHEDKQGTLEGTGASWATWLVGSQRFVIVSKDTNILQNPSCSHSLERLNEEFELSFNSIGLSLLNDVIGKEIMYMCMASSGVVWEHRKMGGKKYRPFTDAQTTLLEKVYMMHNAQIKIAAQDVVNSHYVINSNLEADFSLMQVSKPFRRHIRRTFHPGVWLQLQRSESQRNLHTRVNKFQMDNQMMDDVLFPVVVARVPPPKGVMAETVPKPFLELSVVTSTSSRMFTQFQYFRLLIQEFHVYLELTFLFAALETLFPDQSSDQINSAAKCEQDMTLICQDLATMVAAQSRPSRRDFYQHLHLSPIKMHLSFSIAGLDSSSNDAIKGKMIHLFLQSVGVTLTEVQDVVFKLGYFERQNSWLNREGLMSEVTSHYASQGIQQLYRVVLGLDVIGNPVGLVMGVTKGVGDLFYEPIQGAVEGPGEFAEGLFYGMRSFMGKTVGGTAGAFSRITGTFGKGLASLTFDEEFQKRRREEAHKKPADGLESFARGGKGVLTGVMDGVTGVFTKPISGAKEEGVEGFFKGVGIGVVGLVTRPASGVVDFASGSLDAVMRVTDSSEDVTPVRPPRSIARDGIVRPYDFRSAMGTKILKEIEKGQIYKTDSYVAHTLSKGERAVLMGTNQRILLVSKNDLLGQWKVEWTHFYRELSEAPLASGENLRLTVRVAKKKVLGFFGGGDNSKEVPLHDEKEAKLVATKLSEAFAKAMTGGEFRRFSPT